MISSLVHQLLSKEAPYSSNDFTLSHDEVILYNLATGCVNTSIISSLKQNLKYTYESALTIAFPTMSSAIGVRDVNEFFVIPELIELSK